MITLTQIAAFRDSDTLEKARHGRYADTATNRRLHRVGQEYGQAAKEDPESEKKPQAQQETEQPKKERSGDSVKRELELLEEHKDSIVEKYGEKAYNKKVESLKKEGEDFEQKETVKELKERADKEDADKVMKEEEEKEQKDKALQEAIGRYKEKQEYLKKEVQAIKDMAKKLKRKADSYELEDILEDFDKWMHDYGSELKVDIEKEVKEDNLILEEVEDYLDELEEYALAYYEQDVKGVKEELEGLMDKLNNSKKKSPKTVEDYRKLDKEKGLTDKQFKKYLELPGVKERYEEAKIKFEENRKAFDEARRAFYDVEEVASDFIKNKIPGWFFSPYFMENEGEGEYYLFKIKGSGKDYPLEIRGRVYLSSGKVKLEPADPEYLNSEQLGIIRKNIDTISKNKKEFDKLVLDVAHKGYDRDITKRKLRKVTKEYREMFDGWGELREVRD